MTVYGVPVERIGEQAQKIHIGKLILTLLVGILYSVGWAAGKISVGISWSLAAVKVGWTDARAVQRGPAR